MPLSRPLDPLEQRIVGALVEKELSTPDGYPLTLNALVAACNQSSNRDPVMRLTGAEIDAALLRLMADLLVWRDRGGRALRWKHSLDEKVGLSRAEKAVIAELLLRGPQTPGELRGRSLRMYEFAGLGEVEPTLGALASRRLVEELSRQPGQKERRWRHLLGDPATVAAAVQRAASTQPDVPAPWRAEDAIAPPASAPTVVTPTAAGPTVATRPSAPGAAEGLPSPAGVPSPPLEQRLAALERRVDELAALVARVASDLGIS